MGRVDPWAGLGLVGSGREWVRIFSFQWVGLRHGSISTPGSVFGRVGLTHGQL